MLSCVSVVLLEEARTLRARSSHARAVASRAESSETKAALSAYAVEVERRAAALEAQVALSVNTSIVSDRAGTVGTRPVDAGSTSTSSSAESEINPLDPSRRASGLNGGEMHARDRLLMAANNALKALDAALNGPTDERANTFRQRIDALMQAAARARLEFELMKSSGDKR